MKFCVNGSRLKWWLCIVLVRNGPACTILREAQYVNVIIRNSHTSLAKQQSTAVRFTMAQPQTSFWRIAGMSYLQVRLSLLLCARGKGKDYIKRGDAVVARHKLLPPSLPCYVRYDSFDYF